MTHRRFFVPEVIQTSAMDCGPASLKALLDGYGVPVNYGRLREACQTDVDGTSIDTLEEVARDLGIDAQQIMLPLDHVMEAGAKALPALAVVRHPNGGTHFVVIWSRLGTMVQVMDPASGRRWKTRTQLTEDLYAHVTRVPASAWREWAGSEEFLRPLRSRLRRAGFSDSEVDELLSAAVADETWISLARVDAACRCTTALIDARVMRRGATARAVCRALVETRNTVIPTMYWSTWRPEGDVEDDTILFRGAVVVRFKGRRKDESAERDRRDGWMDTVLQPESSSALKIVRMLRSDGLLNAGLHLSLSVITALVLVLQALMFRGLISVVTRLSDRPQLLAAGVALFALSVWLVLQRTFAAMSVLRYGRLLSATVRIAFLDKIPRLGERYFRSRLTADMAERGHSLDSLRRLPILAGRIASSFVELVVTVAGLIWIAPGSAIWAVAAGASSLLVPLALQPSIRERDLRVRTHVGALARFYLDAMIGLIPIRAHAAQESFQREQDNLLQEWVRASVALLRTAVTGDALQSAAAMAGTVMLLIHHLGRGNDPVTSLLVVYWALQLPYLGTYFATALRQYPMYRNIFLRAVEPLGAPDDDKPGTTSTPSTYEGVAIRMRAVSVEASGHTILQGVDITVAAGEQIAVVGASGAGKSTLVGLLLGWYRSAAGSVEVDGELLTPEVIARLRQTTAWVDPGVHIWNHSLLQNLTYGARGSGPQIAFILDQTELISMLDRLPEGMQTHLGEGGGLLSGGEGQRVRLGRAFARPDARLVILDEPFRGLDRDKRHVLLQRARRHWSGATVLCITHDVSETIDFPRVLVVDRGRIVEDARPHEAKNREGSPYRAILLAEERIRRERWGDPSWRRVLIDARELSEQDR